MAVNLNLDDDITKAERETSEFQWIQNFLFVLYKGLSSATNKFGTAARVNSGTSGSNRAIQIRGSGNLDSRVIPDLPATIISRMLKLSNIPTLPISKITKGTLNSLRIRSGGSVGQVLTRTNAGHDWQDAPIGIPIFDKMPTNPNEGDSIVLRNDDGDFSAGWYAYLNSKWRRVL